MMTYETLQRYAKDKQWSALEQEWLTVIEEPRSDSHKLLSVLDTVIGSGQEALAGSLGWAWLSLAKESCPAPEALRIGEGLLKRLRTGDDLRGDILALYRKTYADRPDLEAWITRSGLAEGKSVRRAQRYLELGLKLTTGCYLLHRTEETAAQLMELDAAGDQAVLRTARRSETLSLDRLIEDYDLTDEHDFRVLQQLNPNRITELLGKDPLALVIGVLRSHRDGLDRDVLKSMLSPRYLPAGQWSEWWTRLREAVKRTPNVRIEGRSPMMLIYDPVGQSPEMEIDLAMRKADSPREWLELAVRYLRETRERKGEPDATFLQKLQTFLLEKSARFEKHKDPAAAFSTVLILERLAADGVKLSADAHGRALALLKAAPDPVRMVASVADGRLWLQAVQCLREDFSNWPNLVAELLLIAPPGHCDRLAQMIEEAEGGAELLQDATRRILADPGKYTDAFMWLWKGPAVKANLPLPPYNEMLTTVLALVGPAKMSAGLVDPRTEAEVRAKVRGAINFRNYERVRQLLEVTDEGMARSIRRLVDRADGLGPSVQDDIGNLIRRQFPQLYAKKFVPKWEDDAVWFTESGLKAKRAERDELVNVKMRDNARAIGEAASRGDLSENSEYKFALEERDLLRARLAKMNEELDKAKMLTPADVTSDHVSIGHRVKLRPTDGSELVTVTIMGAGDSDLARRVFAYQTPFALGLLGHKQGETVKATLDGVEREFVIEGMENVLN